MGKVATRTGQLGYTIIIMGMGRINMRMAYAHMISMIKPGKGRETLLQRNVQTESKRTEALTKECLKKQYQWLLIVLLGLRKRLSGFLFTEEHC